MFVSQSKEGKEVSQYRYNNEMDFPLDRYNPFYYAFNPFNSGVRQNTQLKF
jgi:hypothetical protein